MSAHLLGKSRDMDEVTNERMDEQGAQSKELKIWEQEGMIERWSRKLRATCPCTLKTYVLDSLVATE